VTFSERAPIATHENVFAYDKNQASPQANASGDSEIPLNVGCQNPNSLIQGEENGVATGS
jgi:hypothetical protein